MAGYPSNLAKKFSPTEQFQQHILLLLPLYNAQWWGYESLTAIVLVVLVYASIKALLTGRPDKITILSRPSFLPSVCPSLDQKHGMFLYRNCNSNYRTKGLLPSVRVAN